MTTNLQLARTVAQHVELRTIVLKSAHVDSFVEPEEQLEELTITQQHRCSYREKSTEEKREIHVLVEFKFLASKDDNGEGAAVKLDAAFQLVYELGLEVPVEPKCVQHFADLNGVYNAWPYWRELVQSAAARVGLGAIVLPVYRPSPAVVSDESEMAAEAATAEVPN